MPCALQLLPPLKAAQQGLNAATPRHCQGRRFPPLTHCFSVGVSTHIASSPVDRYLWGRPTNLHPWSRFSSLWLKCGPVLTAFRAATPNTYAVSLRHHNFFTTQRRAHPLDVFFSVQMLCPCLNPPTPLPSTSFHPRLQISFATLSSLVQVCFTWDTYDLHSLHTPVDGYLAAFPLSLPRLFYLYTDTHTHTHTHTHAHLVLSSLFIYWVSLLCASPALSLRPPPPQDRTERRVRRRRYPNTVIPLNFLPPPPPHPLPPRPTSTCRYTIAVP